MSTPIELEVVEATPLVINAVVESSDLATLPIDANPDLTDYAVTINNGVANKTTWQKIKDLFGAGGAWGSITGTLSAQTDLQTALDAKQDEAIVVSANQTAVNDGVYTVVASATFTDPTPVEGRGFSVLVRNGTATVGGTAYATAGTFIRRVYHSGAWANYVNQAALGYTAENVANKSTNVNTDQASDTKYPSVKAVYDWVVGLLSGKQDTLVSGTNIKSVNGSSLLGSGDLSIATSLPAGTVLQCLTAVTGPTMQTINSATPVTITGLSLTITPSSAINKIVITSSIVHTCPSGSVKSFGIYKNGSPTVSTSGNGNENNMQVTLYDNHSDSHLLQCVVMHSELAGGTSPISYEVVATSAWGGSPVNLYINGRPGGDMNGFSYLTIYEIKG